MFRVVELLLVLVLAVAPAWAQPREWSDDFQAVATYDGTTLLAPCYGSTVSTKYTLIEALSGDIFNERAVSGGGKLLFSISDAGSLTTTLFGRFELTMIGVVNLGQGCSDTVGVPFQGASEAFTSSEVCVYGGYSWNPMELLVVANGDGLMFGPDGKPAVANVDDDQDGTTDEIDENPFRAPAPTASGYGPPFPAGLDARPGVATVDDDGNGTVDDVGETCWPGSDDGDDRRFIPVRGPAIRGDLTDTDAILGWISPSSTGSLFCIYEIVSANLNRIQGNDELSAGFYSPYIHYNYVYCASGTCYGAMLWVEGNISNPVETVGPLKNTLHNGPSDSIFGFYHSNGYEDGEDHDVYHRNEANRVNSNFSDAFWVVSGDPMVYPYFPSLSEDLDGDKDVDGNDFLTFSLCYNGALRPPQSGCANLQADLDGDGDVDGFDFTTWSLCHNGSLKRPQPGCMTPSLTACP